MWKFFWDLLELLLRTLFVEIVKGLAQRWLKQKEKEKPTSASSKRHRGKASSK